jgi:predicted nucleic acid-binding protein
MPGKSSAFPEGVVDVSIIVPTCFENPLKEESIKFTEDVLAQKKRAVLPVTALMGAYHIATRYLKVPRVAVKKVLEGIAESGSAALYPQVTPENAVDGLDYACAYGIESWDGYLIAIAKGSGTSIIYSLDMELAKAGEVTVVVPFSPEAVSRYHDFLRAKGF